MSHHQHNLFTEELQKHIMAECLNCFSTKKPAAEVAADIICTYNVTIDEIMYQESLFADPYEEDNEDYGPETYPSARVQVWLTPKQKDDCNYEGSLLRNSINELHDDINEPDENHPQQYAISAADIEVDHEGFNFFLQASDVSLAHVASALRDGINENNVPVVLNVHEEEVVDEIKNYPSLYANSFATAVVDITLDTLIEFATAINNAASTGDDEVIDTLKLTLPTGTPWGIFDPTTGSGSLMECTTANDVTITMNDLIAPYGGCIHVNEREYNNYGYCVTDVYGDMDSQTELSFDITNTQ